MYTSAYKIGYELPETAQPPISTYAKGQRSQCTRRILTSNKTITAVHAAGIDRGPYGKAAEMHLLIRRSL